MIVSVVGIGKLVEGNYQGYDYKHRALYVSYSDPARIENGLCTERFKVPDHVSNLKGITIGSEVDVVFNRYGKIIDVKGV